MTTHCPKLSRAEGNVYCLREETEETMSFLTMVGAFVVGSVSAIALVVGTFAGWTLASEKLKHPAMEPTLPLALLVVLGLDGWILDATAGDAGVFGLLLGLVVLGTFVYHYLKRTTPTGRWERLVTWLKRR
jgi:ABC-type sulfate transport system permease component